MFKAKVMDAPALGSPESEKEKIGCWPFKRLLSLSPQPSPQEIYFESRGKCCKKLLRYNGYTNKVQKKKKKYRMHSQRFLVTNLFFIFLFLSICFNDNNRFYSIRRKDGHETQHQVI